MDAIRRNGLALTLASAIFIGFGLTYFVNKASSNVDVVKYVLCSLVSFWILMYLSFKLATYSNLYRYQHSDEVNREIVDFTIKKPFPYLFCIIVILATVIANIEK